MLKIVLTVLLAVLIVVFKYEKGTVKSTAQSMV